MMKIVENWCLYSQIPICFKSITYTIRDESSIDNDLIFTIGKDVEIAGYDHHRRR